MELKHLVKSTTTSNFFFGKENTKTCFEDSKNANFNNYKMSKRMTKKVFCNIALTASRKMLM